MGMMLTHLLVFIIMYAGNVHKIMPRWSFIVLAGLSILYFLIFFMTTYVYFLESRMKSEKYLLAKKGKMAKENELVSKEILDNVSVLRQNIQDDAKHLNRTLEVDEIRTMMADAIEKYKWAYQTRICENQVVDALLLNKMTIAKDRQIKMYTQVVVPTDLQVSDLDIISLFSNLIDNAIEACSKLPVEKRFISVTAGTFVNALYLCVENSKAEDVNLVLENAKTSKKEKHLHGYGIQIVRKIIKQYSGNIIVENKKDTVSIKLYIKI